MEAPGQPNSPAATINKVRQSCQIDDCRDFDAVVFIHGIFGGLGTFRTTTFDWPAKIPREIAGRRIDVFEIDYTTSMFTWLRKDIATLDDVVYGIFDQIYPEGAVRPRSPLIPRQYRSVGFIAHSLGGNVAPALLHTVKTELGHQARARYGYVISLGTPVSGAQIANVGLIVKQLLHMRDPLLQSLENDNTFLRMLAHWRRSENIKATRFDCRPVALYAGIEGARLYRFLKVVPQSSAETPLRELGLTGDFAWFDDRDHMSIAKPVSEQDPVYDWVNRMMTREMTRLNKWQEDHPHELCRQVIDVDD